MLFLILISVVFVLVIKKLLYKKDDKSVFVVVLGDLGRSPRMNYHCLSLVNLGYKIKFIGYYETKPMDQIVQNQNIEIVPLQVYPKFLQVGPSIVQYALKAIFLTLNLLFALIKQRSIPKFVFVQNPPSIPTLAVVFIYAKFLDTKFVIDWHNYGFTILALKSGSQHILVKICKRIELLFGQMSDLNFCVTEAMKNDLKQKGIEAITLYDKAHERFTELSDNQIQTFYAKLHDRYKLDVDLSKWNSPETKPVVIVSSSSWTEDEDFGLLLDAFQTYQQNASATAPDIVCILSGKGPLKDYYEQKFNQLALKNVKVYFVWLDADDYPLLLGSADLGLCFHKSSSNLDLPMKVVDMFGARLPVCALSFSCISELVKENENGMLFSTADELANHFMQLVPELRHNYDNSRVKKFRQNLRATFLNWNQEWSNKCQPALNRL